MYSTGPRILKKTQGEHESHSLRGTKKNEIHKEIVLGAERYTETYIEIG